MKYKIRMWNLVYCTITGHWEVFRYGGEERRKIPERYFFNENMKTDNILERETNMTVNLLRLNKIARSYSGMFSYLFIHNKTSLHIIHTESS